MTAHPDVDGDLPVHVGEPVPLPPVEPAEVIEKPARRRLKLTPRSLNGRLVAGVVSLVVMLVLLVSGCTYFALRSFLYNRLDQQVSSAAETNGPYFLSCLSRHCTLTPQLQTEFVAVLNSSGSESATLPTAPSYANLKLSATMARRIAQDPDAIRTVTNQGVKLRITAFQDPESSLIVVTGLQTHDVDRTLGRLVFLEIVIGGTAILLAGMLTTYGVRASLSGLYRVTNTAKGVAEELSPEGAGLDRRVEVDDNTSEVGQLAESMNTLLAAVETQFAARVESEERMRQFLADASHELRTPLTSIRGYAELARMQRAAGDSDEDNIGRIESEGTRMSRLVEDLLMLARGDQDAIPRIELVDVAEVVDDAVSGVRAANPQRNVVVEPVASYNVIGDPDQLVRVIRNLLTNAVVHTPTESPIRVHTFLDGPGIAIQVIDGGPGLPPEEAAHVFERFWRADKARTRARGGSGLGLSIVASVVHAHGGAAHFESTVAGGSTVTVWLPGVTT